MERLQGFFFAAWGCFCCKNFDGETNGNSELRMVHISYGFFTVYVYTMLVPVYMIIYIYIYIIFAFLLKIKPYI